MDERKEHNAMFSRSGTTIHKAKNGTSDNGLLDIAQALNWVQSHISDFGGKPENITLAGQGAGAVGVGLFSLGHGYNCTWIRLIMQSDSPMYPFIVYPKETSLHSCNIAKFFGCANDSYLLEDHREEV
ncbi:hypothetical protein AVEN_46017-1 [Araneus ventricosus]|uniref:Carboxylesterase type B domain-containing protein n=1 Tax=Araneus ventricosus TaxID=182803 RepID=A0A4Y2M126_ARAVE|nr:hypothetical protein AVEN_46017-1 [Araneus ventricosus]